MRFLETALIAVALLFSSVPGSNAQTYPTRPIRVIIPLGAGTPSDVLARTIGQSIAPALGQPLVVENRPGANGIIGTEACAKAVPDAYTFCVVAHPHISINPFVYEKLPYDPRELTPVVQIALINNALAVSPSIGAKTLGEFVEIAKAKPGAINFASWGIGSTSHLYLAWLENRTGTHFNHIQYKEPAQAWAAALKDEAQAIVNTTGLVAAQAKAGKLRALAVSGVKRSSFLPDVPTFKELGWDLGLGGWIGMFGPGGTPREAVQRLNAEVNKLLADLPFVEKTLTPFGLEPAGGSAEQYAAFLKTDREASAALVKLAGVKPQ